MSHAVDFLVACEAVCRKIDYDAIDRMALALRDLRERNGRLFVIGLGGGAGHASHAVCDFRKLCGIDAYSPVDNVSELTAWANDWGYKSIFDGYLCMSRATEGDGLLVFSVGGGTAEVSLPIIAALHYARENGMGIFGVVGRDGGETKRLADICVVVPTVGEGMVTPLTESFQAVVWHCLVSHPELQINKTVW